MSLYSIVSLVTQQLYSGDKKDGTCVSFDDPLVETTRAKFLNELTVAVSSLVIY